MKEFGTLYVFELKKILGQRLVLVSLLLGAAMIFGWNLLTFSSTGYYYNVYNAQDGTVERQIGNYEQWRPWAGITCEGCPGSCWTMRSWSSWRRNTQTVTPGPF